MKVCVLCGKEFTEWGNNPEPVAPYEDGQCCDWCNMTIVLPARMGRMQMGLPMRETEEDPT
jgi:hypothetical protein